MGRAGVSEQVAKSNQLVHPFGLSAGDSLAVEKAPVRWIGMCFAGNFGDAGLLVGLDVAG
jgi:hypothetical protein